MKTQRSINRGDPETTPPCLRCQRRAATRSDPRTLTSNFRNPTPLVPCSQFLVPSRPSLLSFPLGGLHTYGTSIHDPFGRAGGRFLCCLPRLGRAPAGSRHAGNAGSRGNDLRGRDGVSQASVHHDRHLRAHHCRRDRDYRRRGVRRREGHHQRGLWGKYYDRLQPQRSRGPLGGRRPHGNRLLGRCSRFSTRWLHRHVHRRALQLAHSLRRHPQPEGSDHSRTPRRRGIGLSRRGSQPPRRLNHLLHLQRSARQPRRYRAVSNRRLRLRRQLRRALRPARRRHLHEGGRRRR